MRQQANFSLQKSQWQIIMKKNRIVKVTSRSAAILIFAVSQGGLF